MTRHRAIGSARTAALVVVRFLIFFAGLAAAVATIHDCGGQAGSNQTAKGGTHGPCTTD